MHVNENPRIFQIEWTESQEPEPNRLLVAVPSDITLAFKKLRSLLVSNNVGNMDKDKSNEQAAGWH
jgi:hypothetical protein